MMRMIRGERCQRVRIIGCGGGSLAALMAGLAVVLVICLGVLSKQSAQVEAAPADDAANSMLGQAKKFLDSGRQQQQQQQQQQPTLTTTSRSTGSSGANQASGYPLSLLSASSDRDPRLEEELRRSIKVATDLINNYRQNGLSSLPSLPNLPGVGTVMRLPDKLLRAELSMIQDEIRMAMEMMNNPLAATMNAPRDIASMFYRMAEQLEQ